MHVLLRTTGGAVRNVEPATASEAWKRYAESCRTGAAARERRQTGKATAENVASRRRPWTPDPILEKLGIEAVPCLRPSSGEPRSVGPRRLTRASGKLLRPDVQGAAQRPMTPGRDLKVILGAAAGLADRRRQGHRRVRHEEKREPHEMRRSPKGASVETSERPARAVDGRTRCSQGHRHGCLGPRRGRLTARRAIGSWQNLLARPRSRRTCLTRP